jgi:hypothetical protein
MLHVSIGRLKYLIVLLNLIQHFLSSIVSKIFGGDFNIEDFGDESPDSAYVVFDGVIGNGPFVSDHSGLVVEFLLQTESN